MRRYFPAAGRGIDNVKPPQYTTGLLSVFPFDARDFECITDRKVKPTQRQLTDNACFKVPVGVPKNAIYSYGRNWAELSGYRALVILIKHVRDAPSVR